MSCSEILKLMQTDLYIDISKVLTFSARISQEKTRMHYSIVLLDVKASKGKQIHLSLVV